MKPGSSWQVDEQPSSDTVFPSSHCSVPPTIPSPQTLVLSAAHVPPTQLVFVGAMTGQQATPVVLKQDIVPNSFGQEYPGSTWHVGEQPSPAAVLPSSHSSPGST